MKNQHFIGTSKKIERILEIFSKNFENLEIILEISKNCRQFYENFEKFFLKILKSGGIFQEIPNISKKFVTFTKKLCKNYKRVVHSKVL